MIESKNITFRKILNFAESVEIDEEEFNEQNNEVQNNFVEEFSEELKFLEYKMSEKKKEESKNNDNDKSTIELNLDILEEESSFKKKFKFVHRAIASRIHPDIAGPEFEDYFKDFQEAWRKEDLVFIFKIVKDLKISLELDKDLSNQIIKELDFKKQILKKNRTTLKWAWSKSKRDQETRDRVLHVMGIDKDEFSKWKLNKNCAKTKKEIRQKLLK